MLLVLGAVAGLLCSPIIGILVDIFGPVLVLVPSLVLEAISLVVWAYAHTFEGLIASNLIIAVTGGAVWGPGSTLLARLIDKEHRQRAFGMSVLDLVDLLRPALLISITRSHLLCCIC